MKDFIKETFSNLVDFDDPLHEIIDEPTQPNEGTTLLVNYRFGSSSIRIQLVVIQIKQSYSIIVHHVSDQCPLIHHLSIPLFPSEGRSLFSLNQEMNFKTSSIE